MKPKIDLSVNYNMKGVKNGIFFLYVFLTKLRFPHEIPATDVSMYNIVSMYSVILLKRGRKIDEEKLMINNLMACRL